jgi:hypothetical protein
MQQTWKQYLIECFFVAEREQRQPFWVFDKDELAAYLRFLIQSIQDVLSFLVKPPMKVSTAAVETSFLMEHMMEWLWRGNDRICVSSIASGKKSTVQSKNTKPFFLQLLDCSKQAMKQTFLAWEEHTLILLKKLSFWITARHTLLCFRLYSP